MHKPEAQMDIVYTTLVRNFQAMGQMTPPQAHTAELSNGRGIRHGMGQNSANVLRKLILIGAVLIRCTVPSTAAETASSPAIVAQRAIALAQKGRCKEAIPILKISSSRISEKNLKFNSTMLLARCAMSEDQTQTAVEALIVLNREFPNDPEVLYTTTHFYSALAGRASQTLAAVAPESPQAEKLEAEAFESQGDWDKAAAQYEKILAQHPNQPEIHFRLGRILLSRTPPDLEKANQEFQEELKGNPNNASAEFMLGETARQTGQWDEAVKHFSRASKLDEGFVEAYLALGMSLNAAGKFSDAVPPLQIYVKMQPGDPAGHYQLATAYARLGRKSDADREIALQREAATKTPRTQER